MSKPHPIHDRIFRVALIDVRVARDFLQHYLPQAIQDKLDLQTLQLCSNHFIAPELRELETDIVFSTPLKSAKDPVQKAYCYFHLESQRKPEKLMAYRMVQYTINIIARHLKETQSTVLPVVIPIVVYSGKRPYPYSTNVFDLFGDARDLAQQFMFQSFELIDFSQIPDETMRQHLWSGFLEIAMKHIDHAHILGKLESISELCQQLTHQGAEHYLKSMIHYLLSRADIQDKQAFFNWIQQNFSPTIQQDSMTIAQQLHSEGFQQGIQQGIQQGMQQGEQQGMVRGILSGEKELLFRLLTRRFTQIPKQYVAILESSDAKTLLELGDRVLDAKTLDEIFQDKL